MARPKTNKPAVKVEDNPKVEPDVTNVGDLKKPAIISFDASDSRNRIILDVDKHTPEQLHAAAALNELTAVQIDAMTVIQIQAIIRNLYGAKVYNTFQSLLDIYRREQLQGKLKELLGLESGD